MLTWHYMNRDMYDYMPISKKTTDKLFFLKDTNQIYCGTEIYDESIVLYTGDQPSTRFSGKVYINKNTLEGKIWNGNRWVKIINPVINRIEADFIRYSDILYIDFDNTYNNLKVTLVDYTEDTIELADTVLEVLYDRNTKEFVMTSCYAHLSGCMKRINLVDFVSFIEYKKGNITIKFGLSDSDMIINAHDIIESDTLIDDIITLVITSNKFIAGCIALDSPNNISIESSNDIYTIYRSDVGGFTLFALNNDNTLLVSTDDIVTNAISKVTDVMQISVRDVFNVGHGFSGQVLTVDEDGYPEPSGIIVGGAVMSERPTHGVLATEAAIANYIPDSMIPVQNIAKSYNIDMDNPSDENVVSEKAFLKHHMWNVIME